MRFAYEWHSDAGQWFRAYGNENWHFTADGLMSHRHASINDVAIEESERTFHWDRSGPRPTDHPGLSELGLSPDRSGLLNHPFGRCGGIRRTRTVRRCSRLWWKTCSPPPMRRARTTSLPLKPPAA